MSSENKPAYEIISFPVSEAYLKDSSVFKPVTDFIGAHAPGAIYTGLQVEEPTNVLTGFVGWNNVQQHEEFEKEPVYADLGPLVAPVAAGASEVVHVTFEEGDELRAFSAPITELVWLTPKNGVSFDDLRRLVAKATAFHNADVKRGADFGGFGAAFGPVYEDKNKLGYVAGWKSVEAHNAWAKANAAKFNELAHGLKINVRSVHLHHWFAQRAKDYGDVADLKAVHLKLASGRDD